METFDRVNQEHFGVLLAEFWREDGPDMRTNERLQDLMRAYSQN